MLPIRYPFFVLVSTLAACQSGTAECSHQADLQFVEQLYDAGREDQRVRAKDFIPDDWEARSRSQLAVDQENTDWLLERLDKGELPPPCSLGKKGVTAVWLIAQHSQDDTIRSRLTPFLETSAQGGFLDKRNYYTFVDRVELRNTGTQIYGTQYQCDHATGERFRRPVRDEENLAYRRKTVGLGSASRELFLLNTFTKACEIRD